MKTRYEARKRKSEQVCDSRERGQATTALPLSSNNAEVIQQSTITATDVAHKAESYPNLLAQPIVVETDTEASLSNAELVLREVTTSSNGSHSDGAQQAVTVTQDELSNNSMKSSAASPLEIPTSKDFAESSGIPLQQKSVIADIETKPTRRKRRAAPPETVETSKNKRSNKKAKPQPKSEEIEFELSWICSECKEAECAVDPSAEQLLICEGKCHRLFHFPCAGLAKLPTSDEPWLCSDCQESRHCCILCHEYGTDDDDVFCCERDRCGLYFHESCLTMSNIDYIVIGSDDDDEPTDDAATKASVAKRLSFSCPAHWCWTCKQSMIEDGEDEVPVTKAKKKSRKKSSNSMSFCYKTEGRLYRCMECPRAYHLTCVPPLARFHELALLCHEHSSTYKLPDLDLDNSVQKSVEAVVERKFRKAFLGSSETTKRLRPDQELCLANVFFVGVRGDVITDKEKVTSAQLHKTSDPTIVSSELSFYLPSELKDEVHAKPPPYRHLNALKYVGGNRPKRLPPSDEVCNCAQSGFTSCGDECLNRMLGMECTGDGNGPKNPYCNCSIGLTCGNRAIGQRKSAKCRPEREGGRGWGLISVDKIRQGDYVQEYGGEVIDEKTKAKRLDEWARDHPNDPNFYIMSLQQGWYIDARNESNLARFINHSCEPNCRVLQMNVGGSLHMGIYALRDIAPGEFLSYDYHFDTRHGDKFRCRCGSRFCRGTMKSCKSQATNEKKTKTEVWDDAKARFDRDKKFLEDVYESEARRLNLVDALVPCANGKDELVANGPQVRYRDFALRNRMFLWRNVIRGSDFVARFSRKRKCAFIAKPLESKDMVSILVAEHGTTANGMQ